MQRKEPPPPPPPPESWFRVANDEGIGARVSAKPRGSTWPFALGPKGRGHLEETAPCPLPVPTLASLQRGPYGGNRGVPSGVRVLLTGEVGVCAGGGRGV